MAIVSALAAYLGNIAVALGNGTIDVIKAICQISVGS